jgi:acyl dehydratase
MHLFYLYIRISQGLIAREFLFPWVICLNRKKIIHSVRQGDELRVESEILEVRPSKWRPGQGKIKLRTTTSSQNGKAVQVLVADVVVPCRPVIHNTV